MPSAYWGAGQALSLFLPQTWQEWMLLCGYVLLFTFLLFRDRLNLQEFSLRQWIGWLTLGVLALIASQLFPVSIGPISHPVVPVTGDPFSVSLLAAVPSLLAGVILGPGPALLVGMSAGLGRALGQSHQIYDLFHYAFAAWIAASLLHVKYRGRLYSAFRSPVISGTLSQSSIAFMAGFVVFALSSEVGLLGSLDLALAETTQSIVPLFVEGLSGGLIVALILLVMPAWRTGKDLIPSPGHRSVHQYLLTNQLLFGGTVLVIVTMAAFVITTFVSTRLVIAELAAQANASTVRLAELQVQPENDPGSSGEADSLVARSNVEGTAPIDRVKKNSLAKALDGLVDNNPNVSGAIVDLDGAAIVEVGPGDHLWIEAINSGGQPVSVPGNYGGAALLGESKSGARQLIYLAPQNGRELRVAAAVPYEVVLRQALGAALPLVLALVVVAGVFYARLANYSRTLSGSISELAQSSRNAVDGVSITSRAGIGRQDEIGELSRALADMQREQQKRLDELSLLLSVSRESSTSFELSDSLPVVLHGALRATGGAGVRGLVLNPAGGRPLSFAEGPAAESMGVLDEKLMSSLRENDELALGSLQAICEQLEITHSSEMRIKALYALPLQVEGKFLGFLAVGFRDHREFSQNDITLLQSLARQASVLVQKSYLYTYAEGGRRRLAAVLASTSEAVIVTDQTSRILVLNRAMEDAFNIKAEQVVGRTVADVIDSAVLVNALSFEEGKTRDLEIAGKDGRTYYANTSMIVSHERQALGRVAVLHDVTNLKEIDRLKSEFVDNVSHDLRTPLTVLSGYASALSLMNDLTPEQREYTDHILHGVERMIELVENLLDLGRIESGVDLVFEDVDINSLLQEIADEHWLFAHDSGVRLRVRVASNLPTVRCDNTLVSLAISNLLMNGFKYAANSGGMTLAAERSGNELQIFVRDRGPGIAKNDQIRLFEKFYRVKRHGSGAAKGTGLGLAMVKRIAERHGGNAWCKSDEGKGSTFYFSLPIE